MRLGVCKSSIYHKCTKRTGFGKQKIYIFYKNVSLEKGNSKVGS